MFELDIEMLKEQGLQLVDSAKKTAQDLADKGKNKLDLLNQQARLSKAQRQLGALVYSLHKAGEENPALVEKYIDAVAEVEKAIEEIKANMTDDERAEGERHLEEQIQPERPADELGEVGHDDDHLGLRPGEQADRPRHALRAGAHRLIYPGEGVVKIQQLCLLLLIGLFMLATPCHGSSLARQLHAELEAWAAGEGARWAVNLRLGRMPALIRR